jgi:phosphoribosylformimino-5-aminoimidazole carboxamide ribotide isomerase
VARFELYPAIDLRGGRCVRLFQGDYAQETVYDDDPVRVAREFEAAGASWIHVVDLDAARTGVSTNLGVIEAICAAVGCRVQSGGGVRSVEAAGDLLHAGVARVVVGTAAIEQPALVEELGTLHPGCVAVGLDARGREVAVRGWAEGSGADLVATARRFDDPSVAALVVTSIAVDGALTGPDVGQLRAVLSATSVPVVASGGVGTLDDVRDLHALRVAERALSGAIVGTALYEHRFTVADAVAALA